MSQAAATNLPATTEERASRAEAEVDAPETKKLDALHTEHGDTLIADGVVAKVAGMAAREVPGVFAMGNAARRALSNLAERIPGSQTNVSGGVSIEKGERQTAVEVSIVVEYGVSIVAVSEGIRSNIISNVEHITGLEVIAVNVNVTDVHLPDEDEGDAPTAPASSDRLE